MSCASRLKEAMPAPFLTPQQGTASVGTRPVALPAGGAHGSIDRRGPILRSGRAKAGPAEAATSRRPRLARTAAWPT